MKKQDIVVGDLYSDGKAGLREVLHFVRGDGVPRLMYRVLAAKTEREYLPGGESRSVLGLEHHLFVENFASWAKVRYPAAQRSLWIAVFAARRVKLAPTEDLYMGLHLAQARFRLAEHGAQTLAELRSRLDGLPNDICEVNPTTLRSGLATSLTKKGILDRGADGTLRLSAVGQAYLVDIELGEHAAA